MTRCSRGVEIEEGEENVRIAKENDKGPILGI
jgi:hypothetical protein